jgi:hypothetical protein
VALDSEIRPLKLPGQALFGRRWLLTGGRSPQQYDPSMRTYAATSPCALPSQSSLQERTAFLFHLRLKHSKQAAAICSHAPSRLGSLAPSPLGAWPRLANCCQALCSRITLNGATQPKPNLWSLTFQAFAPVRLSVLWLLAAARVWTGAVGCSRQFAQHLAQDASERLAAVPLGALGGQRHLPNSRQSAPLS